jgi:hypothetical protein
VELVEASASVDPISGDARDSRPASSSHRTRFSRGWPEFRVAVSPHAETERLSAAAIGCGWLHLLCRNAGIWPAKLAFP